MKSSRYPVATFLLIAMWSGLLWGQQPAAVTPSRVVPQLVNFSGKAVDAQGKTISGTAGVTFAIYKDQYPGAPLWMETQNVTADGKGNYTVQLGAATSSGLPLDLFASGEARWLGVRINGGEEQPRVLLLSVPYALKAADAQTLGGLPASAFVLAAPPTAAANSAGANDASATGSAPPPASSDVTTTGGTVNAIPLFSTGTDIQNSAISQTGSGATAKIGINTASPAVALDVHGATTVRGPLTLPANGAATAAAGKNSDPQNFVASAFNSSTSAAVNQTFQWQAQPANNDTANPSATLNLLYGSGTTAPAETGLRIGPKGIIGFAPGQTFPGTGSGITGVTAGADLTGGGTSGNVTLNLDTTKVPQLAASNTFTGSQSVTADYTAIVGSTAGQGYRGVWGIASATSGGSTGVLGTTSDASGAGVIGSNPNNGSGVNGQSGTSLTGCNSCVNSSYGVYGQSSGGYGVLGTVGSSGRDGVHGESSSNFSGVAGFNPSTYGNGVDGEADGSGGVGGYFYGGATGVYGEADASSSVGGLFYSYNGDGLIANGYDYAGNFEGSVYVGGNLSKAGGSFKIDHPLDPANEYLYHSFVESPDMKNIYDGVATLDASGDAVIQMPEWFGVLNRDFRYQLTCIGGFAPVYVAEKLANNQFEIGGGKPGMEVSWQITGIRQDPWANAHRIPVEEEKEAKVKGFYLHPELYGVPAEKGIEWARHPEMMKRMQEHMKAEAGDPVSHDPARKPTPPVAPLREGAQPPVAIR